MGMADLVPGVSGGTIALITGIYERLINAIAAINLNRIKMAFSGRIAQAWKAVDGWFLLAVFAGILTAIFAFASLFKYLLEWYPVLTWSFFMGLIMASVGLLLLKNRSSSLFNWMLLILGTLLGYLLSTQSLGLLPTGTLGMLLAGMIAISAMILPGISGSLILILLGKYTLLITAVESRDWSTLMLFATGCIVGLLLFSRLLKWLLAKHHDATLYVLIGLMAGTLFKVWPWQINGINVMPHAHPNPQLLWSILVLCVAFILVGMLFYIDRRQQPSTLSVHKKSPSQ